VLALHTDSELADLVPTKVGQAGATTGTAD